MTLTALQTLAFASIVVYIGHFLKRKIHFIDRYNLPAPVMSGFIFAIIISSLKYFDVFSLTFTKTYDEALMILFFSSIGYSASYKLLKSGGKIVLTFLLITILGLILQIIAGIGLAQAMGLHSLAGVLTGAVALTGGPGTALAFGPVFESAGVAGASTIGLTTAMGGILLGGLLGAPLATYLIRKKSHNTVQKNDFKEDVTLMAIPGAEILNHTLALVLIMGLGTFISTWINSQGITLPLYIGGMIIAAIFRNIEDHKAIFKIQPDWIEELGSVALTLFIATAIMSLKLDELKNAALPIFVFLAVQAVLVALTALGPVYFLAGKNYDAAVMSSGYVGFMMGTTANAMANMTSLAQKYGPAPRAFLAVPLVGSCFIDFINAALVTLCLNYFK